MKFVLITGDAAVGKMTVGQELMKITALRLFHNHMTIEPILDIFGYFNSDAIKQVREVIFREYAKSDHYGLIFTFMWAFDCQEDWNYVAHVCDMFSGADMYCVELIAPQKIRLQRNAMENRLHNKPSKRDIETSNRRLLDDDKNHRFVSKEGEIPFENYIRIHNSDIPAAQAAACIKDKFDL